MSDKSPSSLAAPAAVVAVLATGFLVYTFWFSPAAVKRSPVIAPVVEEAPAPEAPPSEPPAPPPSALTEPLITPISEVWSTYHGGPHLGGYTDVEIPAAPEVLWRYQADAPIYYTPVADDQGIYANTRAGAIVALDFAGNVRWSRQLMRDSGATGQQRPERMEAPLAAFLSHVYAGAISGRVYALDAGSGEINWHYDLNGTVLGSVNLAAAEGPDVPNRLFVINQDDGALHTLDALTGERLVQSEPIARCDGSPAVAGGKLIFGSCDAALHVFNAASSDLLRDIPLDTDSQVASGPAIAGNSIYSGSHSGYLYHADLATGRIYWVNKDSRDEVFSTPAIAPEHVVFSSSDGNVYGLDRRSGMRKWTFAAGGTPTSAVIAGSRVIVGARGVLYILELATGKELWSHEVSDEIASPAIIRGMVVVGSADGTVTAFGTPSAPA